MSWAELSWALGIMIKFRCSCFSAIFISLYSDQFVILPITEICNSGTTNGLSSENWALCSVHWTRTCIEHQKFRYFPSDFLFCTKLIYFKFIPFNFLKPTSIYTQQQNVAQTEFQTILYGYKKDAEIKRNPIFSQMYYNLSEPEPERTHHVTIVGRDIEIEIIQPKRGKKFPWNAFRSLILFIYDSKIQNPNYNGQQSS